MTIAIRPATEHDLPDLVVLCEGLFREDSGIHDPSIDQAWPQREGKAYFRALMGEPDQRVWTAEAGDVRRVIGYLTARLMPGTDFRPVRVAVLESFYVAPEHRGGGIGTRLTDAFVAWAREERVDRLRVSVSAGNTDAIRLYERLGFAPLVVTMERATVSTT